MKCAIVPSLPTPDPNINIDFLILKDILVNHLTKALSVALIDDSRYYANGVLFQLSSDSTLQLVSSDAIRLYTSGPLRVASFPGSEGKMLVPTKYLRSLLKILKTLPDPELLVEMFPDSDVIRIQGIEGKSIAGDYPPFEAAFPKRVTRTCTLDNAKTIKILKTLLTCADSNDLIRLYWENETMRVSAFRAGVCEATADLPVTSNLHQLQGLEVNYHGTYLCKILAHLGKEATIDWETKERPIRIYDSSCGSFLLVPQRF